MSFLSREQRYQMLCAIKRGTRPGAKTADIAIGRVPVLTQEEEQFIQAYAQEKFDDIMKDPEVVAVMQRLKDR